MYYGFAGTAASSVSPIQTSIFSRAKFDLEEDEEDSKMPVKLIYVVIQTIEKPWDWNLLSANPTIDQEDVQNFPELPWNWRMFSMNPGLWFEFVVAHLDWDWDWTALSENRAITWSHVKRYPNLPWNWTAMTVNPNLSVETIFAHPEFPWTNASKNPNLRLTDVLAHPDYPWDGFDLTMNTKAWTANDLVAHPDLPWHWAQISSTLPMTQELLKNPVLINKWDYSSLSRNPSITLDIIEAFPDQPWDWTRISQNPNLTLDYVLEHPDVAWDIDLLHLSLPLSGQIDRFQSFCNIDWAKLSFNPSITIHDVAAFSTQPWLSRGISANLIPTAETLREWHARLDWDTLSRNPCLRLETVLECASMPWNWAHLSCNRFSPSRI
jgi:hypothetical protein